MPKNDPDQPPKHALPLAEALRKLSPTALLHRLQKGDARLWGRLDSLDGKHIEVQTAFWKNLLWTFDRALSRAQGETIVRSVYEKIAAGETTDDADELPTSLDLWDVRVELPGKRPKRGAPGYDEEDRPLVYEMRVMILADPTVTPMAAAWQFVDRAAGGGTPLVKARRLRTLYGEEFET